MRAHDKDKYSLPVNKYELDRGLQSMIDGHGEGPRDEDKQNGFTSVGVAEATPEAGRDGAKDAHKSYDS